MPLYEYECPEHGRYQALRPMSGGETDDCPKCGKVLQRLLSPFNWSFGWRISDRSMNEPWTPRDELVRDI